MDKKWVFEELIKSDSDNIGLIAYALYKKEKHELASTKRDGGATEKEIEDAVSSFHDLTVNTSSRLRNYKTQATTIMNGLVDGIEERVRKDYQEAVDKHQEKLDKQKTLHRKELSREVNKAKKSAVTQFKNNIDKYPPKNSFSRFGSWTLSGFAGIWAAFLLGSLVLLIASWGTSVEQRQEMVKGFLTDYVVKAVQSPIPGKDQE